MLKFQQIKVEQRSWTLILHRFIFLYLFLSGRVYQQIQTLEGKFRSFIPEPLVILKLNFTPVDQLPSRNNLKIQRMSSFS